jgi:hypothetical protein
MRRLLCGAVYRQSFHGVSGGPSGNKCTCLSKGGTAKGCMKV